MTGELAGKLQAIAVLQFIHITSPATDMTVIKPLPYLCEPCIQNDIATLANGKAQRLDISMRCIPNTSTI